RDARRDRGAARADARKAGTRHALGHRRPDHPARPGVLDRLDRYRHRHGAARRGDDRRRDRRRGADVRRLRSHLQLRRQAPDHQDAGARLPAADRRVAGRRRRRLPYRQGLHLRGHGLCGAGRGHQHRQQAAQACRRRRGGAQAGTRGGGNRRHPRRNDHRAWSQAAPPQVHPGRPRPVAAQIRPEEEILSKAVFVRTLGGPEVLSCEDRELAPPGPGEIRVRNGAIGINFVDVYQRTGLYKLPLPFVAGSEGAGEVRAVGPGVSDFKVGDHVGYTGPVGAYAEERLLPASRAVRLPEGISDETAAAVLLKGGTAQYLLFETYPVKAGETILVHAAAGGVGSILTQWATALGVRVIATAGTDDKVAMAKASGAALAINYSTADWVKAVREGTGGTGVDAVYDGVGRATFEGSLDCLRPRGMMVSYGNASGFV